MMRTTTFPLRNLHVRPAFWGVDRDLKEVMDSIESVWSGANLSSQTSHFKETQKAFLLSMDMPGVNKNDLELHVEGDKILIKAIRKHKLFAEEEQPQEINREVLIPKHVDRENIQAHCEDGVLYLALPKMEKIIPKKIEVSPSGEGTNWKHLLESSDHNQN